MHIMLALRSETMPQSYLVFVEEPGDLFGAVVFSMPEASQRTYSCYLMLTAVACEPGGQLLWKDCCFGCLTRLMYY